MDPVLPFRLKVPKKEEWDGLQATTTSFQVHGYLRVEGDLLIVEWGGTVHVQEAGATAVRSGTEPLTDQRLAIPAADLYRAELTGGWLRPRLTVQARRVGALAPVPSESFGTVSFWYERAERFTAVAVARALNEAIATAESAMLEGETGSFDEEIGNTPPGGSGSS